MRHNIFKSFMVLICSMIVLPVMSQDYMNIFFKNGEFRKFYMADITEIAPSRYDAEGLQHADYDYQHITTLSENYIYRIEDVDSITFTKIDEELAEQNFVSSMTGIIPVLESCETIEDVESKIEEISSIEGVKEAWTDGHELFVAVLDGEIVSFHFDHDLYSEDVEIEELVSKVKSKLPLFASTLSTNGTQLSAAIINQQHKDQSRGNKVSTSEQLIAAFKACGIVADYIPNPTIEFFYDNGNSENNKHIYDYDIIFLITHGKYGPILYNKGQTLNPFSESYKYDIGVKAHQLETSEDLFDFKSKGANNEMSESDFKSYWSSKYKEFKEWRDNRGINNLNDQYINFTFQNEYRNGEWRWYCHPTLTDYFFKDIASGEFKNPNSVLFNLACQSLKGEDQYLSNRMANAFFNRGLGTYLGYTETDISGFNAGLAFYLNLLTGKSTHAAYLAIPLAYREETTANFTNGGYKLDPGIVPLGAKLKILPEGHYDFLFPVTTIASNDDEVKAQYLSTKSITIQGSTTFKGFSDNVSGQSLYSRVSSGFKYGFSESNLPYDIPSGNLSSMNDFKDCFSATIKDVECGKPYYYQAYTYDGLHHNYGNPESFIVYLDLQLSEKIVTLQKGDSESIIITSGNGDYDIAPYGDANSYVTATINGSTIIITALKAGICQLVVTDKRSGQKQNISVVVSDEELELSTSSLILSVGKTYTVTITSGSGNYKLSYSDNSDTFVRATLDGSSIILEAIAEGNAFIIVTDLETGQEKNINVFVEAESEYEKITVSTSHLDLQVGNSSTIQILTGSGDYWISYLQNSDRILNATISGNTVIVKALKEGNGQFMINDRKTGFAICIGVTIAENIVLSDLKLAQTSTQNLILNESLDILITSGNGQYTATSSYNEVATAEITTRNTSNQINYYVSIKGIRVGSTTITVKDVISNQTVSFDVIVKLEEVQSSCPDGNHPHAIDLGLPSGVKWSCSNVGASTPSAYGGYYSWGETVTKTKYDWTTYSLSSGSQSTCQDIGLNISNTQYDVASTIMGPSWCMPSIEELKELKENCTWTASTQNGTAGCTITGPSGKTIFMPFSGYYDGETLRYEGGVGYFLSSNSYPDISSQCRGFILSNTDAEAATINRYEGVTVRAVQETIVCQDHNHPHMLDLGLPSGTKWACCNVGSTKPDDYGAYFTWGDIEAKTYCNKWSTYKYCQGVDNSLTKYCNNSKFGIVDNKTELDVTDDAAYTHWGSEWRTPSIEQIKELFDNCTYESASINAIKCIKFTSKINGTYVYFPISGIIYELGKDGVGETSFYWSRSLLSSSPVYSKCLLLNANSVLPLEDGGNFRYDGCSVRPVTNNKLEP